MFIQFLKKIIGSVIILLFSIVYSTAEIVKSIIIEGNERVNSETIKIFAEVSINDNLNSEDLNLILKRLYKTNFFEDVQIFFEDSLLRIKVKMYLR